MARKRVVSRTITTTECNVLCLNIETAEPFIKEVTLQGTYPTENKMMKAVHKVVDNDTEKAVSISAYNEIDRRYVMDESKFMELADVE